MLEFGIVNFWVYVLGAFAVIIAPGPNSLFVLKTAVTEGRRPALAGALAVLVGDSVLIQILSEFRCLVHGVRFCGTVEDTDIPGVWKQFHEHIFLLV